MISESAPSAPADDTPSSFLRNCWYAAAWSEEIRDRPFGRTICGEKIVLFRKSAGDVVGLSGICPHRFASLDQGLVLEGDRLQCPYHGLEFGADGRCAANPHGAVPGAARLTVFPVVERYSLIWLWMGEDERVDPSLIPDFSCLSDHRYRTIRGLLLTRAHYELVTDNLMDLGHVAFIHRGGLGSVSIADGKHVVQQHGTTLHSNRWCPDGAPSPVWGALFGNYQDNVDHWLNMRWDAPSTMFLDVGVTPAGHDRSEGISVPGTHILTPETETSTHYFWAASRDFALEDDELDIQLRTSIEHAFINEDKPMLEDTQRNMKGRSFDAMRPIILSSDLGAIRARRLLADIRSGRKKQAPSLTEASAALVEG